MIEIPKNLKCPECGGNNLCPDPSIYFKVSIEGWGCLDCENPDFIRIRTFLPKINTPILEEIKSGEFQVLSAHEALKETYRLIKNLKVTSRVYSDHYTNYINVCGCLPEERALMLAAIEDALKKDEKSFREVYIGNQ